MEAIAICMQIVKTLAKRRIYAGKEKLLRVEEPPSSETFLRKKNQSPKATSYYMKGILYVRASPPAFYTST